MRTIIVGLVGLVAGCCTAAAGAPPPATSGSAATAPVSNVGGGAPVAAGWAGRWCGDVHQAGYPPYPLVMVVAPSMAAGTVCGTTQYPSLGCAANLTCLSGGELSTFRENLTVGRDRCVEGGTVSARLSGDTMLWEYRRPDGALDATSTLQRCGP